jgi:hypothetical protein
VLQRLSNRKQEIEVAILGTSGAQAMLRSRVLSSKGMWTMNYAGTAIGKLLNGGHGAKIGACHAKVFAISPILLLGNAAVANTPQSKNIDRH